MDPGTDPKRWRCTVHPRTRGNVGGMTKKQKILVEVGVVAVALVLCVVFLTVMFRELGGAVETLAPKAKEGIIELIGDVAEEIHKRTADPPDAGS